MQEQLTLQYCEANRTKRASSGFKCLCPSCGGKDLLVTPAKAFAYCFECDANYRIGDGESDQQQDRYKAARAFDPAPIRRVYSEVTDYYHSCISKEHEAYLNRRGIDSNAIALFKLGFCPPSTSPTYLTETAREAGIADRHGNPWLANRIVFPYLAEHSVTDLRGRVVADEEPKYKSLYHKSYVRGAVYPYNYDRAMAAAQRTRTLIVTEGEIKAVVADLHGFAIVALPGMLSFRPMLAPQPGIRLVVIFDNAVGDDDRVRIDRAIGRVAQRLPEFSVVTLPLLGERKMDIDSFLLHPKGGSQRFQFMLDNAVEYPRYKQLRRF